MGMSLLHPLRPFHDISKATGGAVPDPVRPEKGFKSESQIEAEKQLAALNNGGDYSWSGGDYATVPSQGFSQNYALRADAAGDYPGVFSDYSSPLGAPGPTDASLSDYSSPLGAPGPTNATCPHAGGRPPMMGMMMGMMRMLMGVLMSALNGGLMNGGLSSGMTGGYGATTYGFGGVNDVMGQSYGMTSPYSGFSGF